MLVLPTRIVVSLSYFICAHHLPLLHFTSLRPGLRRLLLLIHPHRMFHLIHQTPMMPLAFLMLLLRMRMPPKPLSMHVPLPTAPRMEVLISFPGHPRRALGDDFFGCNGLLGVCDVAGAAAACAVFVGGRFARVAFADDVAVDVDVGVGADVAGACEVLRSVVWRV